MEDTPAKSTRLFADALDKLDAASVGGPFASTRVAGSAITVEGDIDGSVPNMTLLKARAQAKSRGKNAKADYMRKKTSNLI